MADYLDEIAAAKADIARVKAEKEAFESSNVPEDVDEEELESWNRAKDLERQVRELKSEHHDAMRRMARLERAAGRARATATDRQSFEETRAALQPVFDELAALEAALAPHADLKKQLADARARYRELTDSFLQELKGRCSGISVDDKRALVVELFAKDVQAGLDGAVVQRRRALVRLVERLWDKYRVTMAEIVQQRDRLTSHLSRIVGKLGYE